MKKTLLIILLAFFVLLVGLTLVYAKHINKEGKKFRVIARGKVERVEPAVPVVERIRSGTLADTDKPKTVEDLKTAMEKAGKIYTLPEEQPKSDCSDMEVIKIATPAGILDEWSLTECVIWVHNWPWGYWDPWPDYFDPYMNCVGTAEYWQLQDPQLCPECSQCGYPIYPIQPTGVQFFIHTPAPCSLDVEFAVTWDYGSIYWGYPFPYYSAPDWSSGPVTVYLPEAGIYYVFGGIPELERPCYHVPFFARFWLLNSDDFQDGPDPERCGPDTTRYPFWLNGTFDIAGVRNQGYYANDLIGGYYDIADIKGGNIRLFAQVLTRDQNDCELESLWHHKASYFDTTEQGEITAYAPDGMPDFNQYDTAFANGGTAYCGPTALANCLWWCFAGGFPWYSIRNWYDAWDPSVPLQLIQELAACMDTDPAYGTDVYDLQQCINDQNNTYLFSLTETTIFQPHFEDIEYQVRLSQDVILLIGFWYYDETEMQWYRLGGHYVTCSGVNWEFFLLSISDPALNAVCDYGWYGDSSGFGYYIPHTEPFCDPFCHYDAGNVSHDYYQVLLESPSPGGILALPQYGNEPEPIWMNFFGQNFTPELESFRSDNPEPPYPVVAEIEYAVVICPKRPFVSDDIESWNIWLLTSNYGEEGLDVFTWQYYPDTRNDGFQGTVILGTDGDDLAFSVTAVDEEIRFYPYGGLECNWGYYDSVIIDKCEASYYHNVPAHELPLDVEMLAIGLDPYEGVYQDHPLGDVIIKKYVIHNTGEETLTDLEWAIFIDLDVNRADYVSDNPSFGGGDSLTNTMWAYDSTREDLVVYVTLAPTSVGKTVPTVDIGDQYTYFYDYVPGGPYDDLDSVMNQNFWNLPDKIAENTDYYDYAYLMSSEKFDLESSNKVLQEYLIWYDWQIPSTDYDAYRHKLYRLLRAAGFYRGDVGDFKTGAGSPGILDVADIIYLINYLFKNSNSPKPFVDQGDVNCDGETSIADIVYMVGYILRGNGIPPIDKNRFFDETYEFLFSRPSLFSDSTWRYLGAP
ncbi:MAG: hypothetical protein WBD28_05195 [Candidatus Zixiibacteriota bacterium]